MRTWSITQSEKASRKITTVTSPEVETGAKNIKATPTPKPPKEPKARENQVDANINALPPAPTRTLQQHVEDVAQLVDKG